MQLGEATLTVKRGASVARLDATHVRFSAHKCFQFDSGAEDLACLRLIAEACRDHAQLAAAVDDGGRFLEYLIAHEPELGSRIVCVTQPRAFGAQAAVERVAGLPVVPHATLPAGVTAVLLADTRMFPRMQMRRLLADGVVLIDPDLIAANPANVPVRAWVPWASDVIYPVAVPEMDFQPGMDLLLIDCPARNLGLMPNGVGYVHNALKHTDVRFQTLDLDIIIYHRFHVRRLCDEGGSVTLANGRVLPSDPWQAEHYDFWTEADTLDFMAHEIEEIATKLIAAAPKVLAMSIQSCNEGFSGRVVDKVKQGLPDLMVLVGGFSCYNADIGLRAFPQADYMCIGEADLTVGNLCERLAAGERPKNVPGVLSKFDDPAVPFNPAPMAHDLDLIEHPRYEWFDLDVYRNYNGYQLTPVIASRGCRWSRCTFCAERFYWRIRSASAFTDELEWLVEQGCHLFMFNESDLNGMPEKVLEICDEVIARDLNIKLTGQLRIHKKSDQAYFRKLRKAGFVALRFGVDAFSENTLRLQKKGYTKATVRQNLRDCWEAGIFSEVNWVIGVPGETEDDVTEGIEFILENKQYIGRLANFNPLILVNGGVYWLEPDKHNIVFREPKEQLMAKYARAIPAHLWYSTEPYIDELVRKKRFERIVIALHDGGFQIGPWAERIIDDVQKARDKMRVGDRATDSTIAAPAIAEAVPTGAAAAEPAAAEPIVVEPVAVEPVPAAPLAEVPVTSATEATVAAVAASAAETPAASTTVEVASVPPSETPAEPAGRKLSEGVGQMSEPEKSDDWFNPDARGQQYVFRAGSILPKDTIATVEKRIVIVSQGSEFFAFEPEVLIDAFGADVLDAGQTSATLLANGVEIAAAVGKGAVPQLARSIGSYNIVQFDGTFYAVPQAIGQVEWGVDDLTTKDGVFISQDMRTIVESVEKAQNIDRAAERAARQIAKKQEAPPPTVIPLLMTSAAKPRATPHLLGAVDRYNLVEYEGWVYGIPQELGPIDLTTTDVIEMEGVIRDLSRDVVEGEIRELYGRPAVAG
jgi:radical SAM superfamily enzyme YgiQ (UPF0313 family)